MQFLVGPTPHDGVIIGQHTSNRLAVEINQEADYAFVGLYKYEILLDDIDDVIERTTRPPYAVLTANSGCNLVICAFLDAGLNFKHWKSIEKAEISREISTSIHPKIIHYPSHDVNFVDDDLLNEHQDVYINTGNCQPFSGANPKAKGMDDERASSWIGGCKIKQRVKRINPQAQCWDEMTVIANHLKREANVTHGRPADAQGCDDLMDEEWGDEHKECNVAKLGGQASRNRWMAVDWYDLDKIPEKVGTDVNALLEGGARSLHRVLPCIVASENTHNPALVTDSGGHLRQLYPVEADRIMGYPGGITQKCEARLSPKQRRGLIGQGVAYRHAFFILKELRPPVRAARITQAYPTMWKDATQEQFEKRIADMGEFENIVQWMRDRIEAEGYSLKPMKLELADKHMARMKVKGGYPVPPLMKETCERTLEELRLQGAIVRNVPQSALWWETNGFMKFKGDQQYDDGVRKGRLLGDFRPENECLKPAPKYWANESPNQLQMMLLIELGQKNGECMMYRMHMVRVYLTTQNHLIWRGLTTSRE